VWSIHPGGHQRNAIDHESRNLSEEIDKFLNSKNAQKSDDSLTDKSKDEDNKQLSNQSPPPLPKKTMSQTIKPPIKPKPISLANHKSVYKKIEDLRITHRIENNEKTILEEDDLILRPKDPNTRVSHQNIISFFFLPGDGETHLRMNQCL
jgi:hypothetical protein